MKSIIAITLTGLALVACQQQQQQQTQTPAEQQTVVLPYKK
jgi:uncharacterized protein YcfL